MDILSYKLGKNSGGGGGGGTTTDDCYWGTEITGEPSIYNYIKRVINMDISNRDSIAFFFNLCPNLIEVKNLNTTGVTNFRAAFYNCGQLTTVDMFDTSSGTNFEKMFGVCYFLTDASLDNILQMLASATNYTGTKTFAYVFELNSTVGNRYYPASRLQALPHYQDFIDAGWTIGY